MVRDHQPERAKRLEAIAKARRLVARRLKHHPSDLRVLRARLTRLARDAREGRVECLARIDEAVAEVVEQAEGGVVR